MHTTQKIKMDLLAKQNIQTVHAVQDDTNSRAVQVSLFEGGVPWQVPENSKILVGYLTENGSSGVYDTLPDGSVAATISENKITFVLVPAALYPGSTKVTIVIADESGNQISTFPVNVDVGANYSYGASAPEAYINLGQWLSASISDLIGGVRYDGAQELTEEQKARARENIGAGQPPLYVTLSHKSGVYLADATFEEIKAAYQQKRPVYCVAGTMVLSLGGVSSSAIMFSATNQNRIYRASTNPAGEWEYLNCLCATKDDLRPTETDEIYFDITDDGVISLKPEYRGACPIYHENFANGLSDYGEKLDGSQNKELPEEIIIPETVNGITVTAYAVGMFVGNNRIKRLVLNPNIKEIPYAFCYNAGNLKEVVGTETVEVLNGYAFTNSGILAARFPNLKQFVDTHHFSCCIDLTVADMGTVITQIPKNCFAMCERLAELRIGSDVTSVADYGFYFTYRLKTLPFMSRLANIGKYGFLVSRVNCDWNSLTGTFGTLATPKDFCGADYWSACSFEKCITPLRSTFHQDNPLWVDKKIGNLDRTWDKGCIIVCAAMAYSAFEGKDLSSPEEFTDAVYAADPTLKDVDPSNVIDGIERYLEAVGYDVVRYTEFNTANLQAMYDALADGAMVIHRCLAGQTGNHDVLIHGINADGEVLCVDPASPSERVGRYEAITYAMPIQNRTRAAEGTDKDWFWIVRKN